MSLDSEIVVVSGLPRSGTSLMMQMLQCGRLTVLADAVRTADVDNPHGYFEYEPVKKTRENPAWLAGARGKVVKIVSSLLYDLPPTESYRIIFMCRDLDEILESQEKMLARLGHPAAPRDKMKASYVIHLDRVLPWAHRQPHIRLLEVSYNELLKAPEREARRLVAFLDGFAAPEQLVKAIDSALYRNRYAGS